MVIKTFLNLKNFETNETNKQMNRNFSDEYGKKTASATLLPIIF